MSQKLKVWQNSLRQEEVWLPNSLLHLPNLKCSKVWLASSNQTRPTEFLWEETEPHKAISGMRSWNNIMMYRKLKCTTSHKHNLLEQENQYVMVCSAGPEKESMARLISYNIGWRGDLFFMFLLLQSFQRGWIRERVTELHPWPESLQPYKDDC